MQELFSPEKFDSKLTASTKPVKPFDIWTSILNHLKQTLPESEIREWFGPIKVQAVNPHELLIKVPNMIFYHAIFDNYSKALNEAKEALGLNILLRFEIDGGEFQENRVNAPLALSIAEQENLSPVELEQTPPQIMDGDLNQHEDRAVSRALTFESQLNPEYTFETFVNGPSNQFAHASCLAVAENPGQTYNPLFLYGSTGLGKTHLLHAVGNYVMKTKPNATITYITSERFINEMIYCLRYNKMWDFRRKYRNCDVLLVDDIHFISGKERTQEEFFHTFNALYEAKKQIVVTSDIFPQEIPDIEDRLRNRFQWGLIADIQPPDIEHRVAILMNKAEKQGIYLNQDVAHYIAHHAKGSIRVLEGALHRVLAFASLQGRSINIELASEILQNVIGEPPRLLTIDAIQKVVADHFKIRIADLKSKKRQRNFSVPRQIAMYLSRERTKASFPEIGEKFGGKDHTTVMHAVNKIKTERPKDLDLKANIESLERKLDQQA